VRFQPEQLAEIDDYRRDQRDIANRPEAVRRLVKQALADRPEAREMTQKKPSMRRPASRLKERPNRIDES